MVPLDGWRGWGKDEGMVGVVKGVHYLLFTRVMKEVAGGGSRNKPGWRL